MSMPRVARPTQQGTVVHRNEFVEELIHRHTGADAPLFMRPRERKGVQQDKGIFPSQLSYGIRIGKSS